VTTTRRVITEAFGCTWRRAWQEDDATRHMDGHEHYGQAWLRLFGTTLPVNADAHEDWGDSAGSRFGARMVLSGPEGESLWVLVHFFVNYQVVIDGSKAREAGPYPTRTVAESHKADIAGYEGVSNVIILEHDAGVHS
jgi:hypothetical protein